MLEKLFNSLVNRYRPKYSKYFEANYNDDNLCSIYLRFDNDKIISQITLWEDLSCHVEILDIPNEEVLVDKRFELNNEMEVIKKFDDYINIISSKS